MSVKFDSLKDGLKRARKARGLTQTEFAQAFKIDNTPVSLTTVRNWEQGRTYPEAKTLEALCDFYGCDLDYLFGRIDCNTHDVQFASDFTGLEQKTITKLGQLKGTPIISLLNHLICSENVLEKLTAYYASKFRSVLKEKPYRYIKGNPSKLDERLFYADVFNSLPVDREKFYEEYKTDGEVSKQMAFTLMAQGIDEHDFIGWLQILHNHIAGNGLDALNDTFLYTVADFCKFRGYGEYLQSICDVALEKYNDRSKGDESSGTD